MSTEPSGVDLSMFAAVLHWWRHRDPEARPRAGPGAYDRPPALMVRRMARLGLDSQKLHGAEPVLFQRLQANCLRCPCPELCVLALMDESIDYGWQEWRDYCPNATELSMLSALNYCCSGLDGTKAERTK